MHDKVTRRTQADALARIRAGNDLSRGQQIRLTLSLSIPAILAQLTTIIMQYIDASMVGQLGANAGASIGLVSSTTWLFGGLINASAAGFYVQVAHLVGADDLRSARSVLRQGLVAVEIFALVLTALGAALSFMLPRWLGGAEEILHDASAYFLVYALSLPIIAVNALCGGMLRCSGNMRAPSLINVMACLLDVVFNLLLIFPSRQLGGFTLPGANLGVLGAAIGTLCANAGAAVLMFFALCVRSPMLHLRRKDEKLTMSAACLKRAVKLAVPIGCEHSVLCLAQIMVQRIISPLGTIAIAANSFAVTAESLCYMPGFGIGDASTTLTGQTLGAGRPELARRLGWLATFLGMAVMTLTALMMYAAAPLMIGILSPDESIRMLGAEMLRIEAFAEPMYAASIVASGALRGAGDTLVPSLMNLISMWAVRIPLAVLLVPRMGLKGAWIAMAIELCVRGVLFLLRLKGGKWTAAYTRHQSA